MRLFISLLVLACTWHAANAENGTFNQKIAQMQSPEHTRSVPVPVPVDRHAVTTRIPATRSPSAAPPTTSGTLPSPNGRGTPMTPNNVITPQQTVPSSTDKSDLNLGVGLAVSTTGIGGYVSLPIAPQFLNVRFGLNYFRYSYNGQADNVDFSFKLTLNTYDALLDWFPFAGRFRLTTGLIYNANQVEASGKPSIAGRYIVNGHTYHANDVGDLKGNVSFPTFVPYIGFGYGNTVDTSQRWSIFSDTGILLNSNPSAKIRSANCTAPGAVCQELDRDLDVLNKSLNNNFKFFKIYPIMRIGIAYRF